MVSMSRIVIALFLIVTIGGCHTDFPEKPIANFVFSPSEGCQAPCQVTFTSTSKHAVNHSWDFGDDSPLETGTARVHEFLSGGDYRVKLIIHGTDGGSSGITKTVHVAADPASNPVADFDFVTTNDAIAPTVVKFENLSMGADKFMWDFGDATATSANPGTSTDRAPSHVYNDPGLYEVTLVALNGSRASVPVRKVINVKTAISPANAFSIPGDSNFPTGVVADESGNVYVCGVFRGTANFGNGNIRSSRGNSDDFFLAKYNGNWQCLWVYTDGSIGDDHVNDIALDDKNNVYITGFLAGSNFDGSASPKGGTDGYVTKLNPITGKRQWIKLFGGPANDQGRALAFHRAVDGARLYLGATVEGDGVAANVEFGDVRYSANGKDFCLAYLSTDDGSFNYSTIVGGSGPQTVEGLKADKKGNVYLVGAFEQSFNFPSITSLLVNKGRIDIYLARWLARTKQFEWVRSYGSSIDDFGYDIAVDDQDNVYLMGMTAGVIPNLQTAYSGDENVFVGKWTSTGEFQKGQAGFNDGKPDYPGGVAVLPNGKILIAGSFSGIGAFPFKHPNAVESVGSTDILLKVLDGNTLTSDGEFQTTGGGPVTDRAIKVCTAPQGYIYSIGNFIGNVKFGEVTLSGSSTSNNTYIVRYKP